jgi:hypothetical protein
MDTLEEDGTLLNCGGLKRGPFYGSVNDIRTPLTLKEIPDFVYKKEYQKGLKTGECHSNIINFKGIPFRCRDIPSPYFSYPDLRYFAKWRNDPFQVLEGYKVPCRCIKETYNVFYQNGSCSRFIGCHRCSFKVSHLAYRLILPKSRVFYRTHIDDLCLPLFTKGCVF